jgi:hypothetical protein
LRNETQWQQFLSAGVDSLMGREMLHELRLAPDISRFKTIAGYILSQNLDGLLDCLFERMTESFELMAHCIPAQSEQTIADDETFIWSSLLM